MVDLQVYSKGPRTVRREGCSVAGSRQWEGAASHSLSYEATKCLEVYWNLCGAAMQIMPWNGKNSERDDVCRERNITEDTTAAGLHPALQMVIMRELSSILVQFWYRNDQAVIVYRAPCSYHTCSQSCLPQVSLHCVFMTEVYTSWPISQQGTKAFWIKTLVFLALAMSLQTKTIIHIWYSPNYPQQ